MLVPCRPDQNVFFLDSQYHVPCQSDISRRHEANALNVPFADMYDPFICYALRKLKQGEQIYHVPATEELINDLRQIIQDEWDAAAPPRDEDGREIMVFDPTVIIEDSSQAERERATEKTLEASRRFFGDDYSDDEAPPDLDGPAVDLA